MFTHSKVTRESPGILRVSKSHHGDFGHFCSGEAPVALDALLLLEHAATYEADREEEDSHRYGCRRVVVLYTPPTVGAVIPSQALVLLCILLPALDAPAVHDGGRVGFLELCRALALGRNLHAEETFVTALADALDRPGRRVARACTHLPPSALL